MIYTPSKTTREQSTFSQNTHYESDAVGQDNHTSQIPAVEHHFEAGLQPKLKIGQPDDPYEREADRMADFVVRQISSGRPSAIEKKEKPALQLKRTGASYPVTAPDNVAQKLSQKQGKGSSLPFPLQAKMEESFGTDFSQVRIHTDREAIQLNQQLGARAFTHGSDVYFNRGEYQPASTEGQRLLAHELTHVVQQDLLSDTSLIQKKAGETNRVTSRGQDELDRRIKSDFKYSEGSGEWGDQSEDRGISDYANHTFFAQVANTAEIVGLPNAARHMRHYLGNTGTDLEVNVDNMLRDVPTLDRTYEAYEEEVKTKIGMHIASWDVPPKGNQRLNLNGVKSSNVYCNKSESADWYYAIGGFTNWWTAKTELIPLQDQVIVVVEMQLHIKDRYNWDKGKSVDIGPFIVEDAQLGRLHEVGLAKEYNIEGTSSPKFITYLAPYKYSHVSGSENISQNLDDSSGNRGDVSRERDRSGIPGRNRN